ncbi:hypothetical protein [Clostridium aciditolerans]|uniref:Uncharacterized protein n=1 Tax=Clostridium aciditolerans TaxID=339861 RepID=A0A934M259_9CLOT|nr:hypothetical protein [Clostridium aciditolerans]MBI6871797.1 hypothetical protein [Clostridium aciditolerans]
MIVKIVNILEKGSKSYKVIVELDNENIVAEWDGNKPEKNREYDVELDIDENFTWGKNIVSTTKNKSLIRQSGKYITIVAKLDFNYEDNFASIDMNESVILIELEGLQHNVSGECVELNCRTINVHDTNL